MTKCMICEADVVPDDDYIDSNMVEEHYHCSVCGLYYDYSYGDFSVSMDALEFYWSYNTERSGKDSIIKSLLGYYESKKLATGNHQPSSVNRNLGQTQKQTNQRSKPDAEQIPKR